MKCWNCGDDLPLSTKICRRCEADQAAHSDLDADAAREIVALAESVSPGLLDELKNIADQHDTAEAFANAILIGPCPACGSENVGDCETDPDYENPLLGRCFACGNVWCPECGRKILRGEKKCPDEDEHFSDLPGFDDLP
jgi:hypothetical protein